ncbi:MAG: osmoprotectant transport system ATP-binding protein [Micromonosporaceae bacterium]|nr:osmoprotectant transport system ATP-binding protein [Micromonosporaceae bacterium]
MITFERVTKRFDDGTVVLNDLDLEIPTGKVTVLVGPSGCGKTTTLRMINRMVEPTAGRILVDGQDIRAADPPVLRRRIGYVIQQSGLFPHRTIVDNIATVPLLLGWSRRRARSRALELLETVGLPATFARRYPYQLSGGQQQRVGVARALAADPPVLLMDEPFSAVDPVVRASLQNELLRLQDGLRKTIVFVTHDIDEAIKLGDMVGVFQVGGGLVQYDTPQHLLRVPATPFVADFLGVDRGIRGLSFRPADQVTLGTDDVIELDGAQRAGAAGVTDAGRAALATGIEPGHDWLLVVDGDRRPAGWLAPRAATGARAGPEAAGRTALAPLQRTFRPDRDSLRVALDSAVLSPSGRAVAVDATGRLVGTADPAGLAAAIRAGHTADAADDAAVSDAADDAADPVTGGAPDGGR